MDGIHPVQAFPVVEQSADVVANLFVNVEYKHLIVACSPPASLALPGQFFHLLCPASEAGEPFLRRPMSIYRIEPERGRIHFLYKLTGIGTRGLATLEPGRRLNMLGPLGIGFTLNPAWKNIVVLGRGVGLATLAPLAAAARRAGIGITAILSARRPELLMSVEVFKSEDAEIVTLTDSDGSSDVENVERRLRDLVEAGNADAFFTCGSNRLMLLMQRIAKEHGIPGQVALEQQMACGLGMCFCCVREFRATGDSVEHRRVCCEGPCFDLQEPLSW